MNEPLQLVTGQTDAEIAANFRKELSEALRPVCEILDRGASCGLNIAFGVTMGPFGRHVVDGIKISRPL